MGGSNHVHVLFFVMLCFFKPCNSLIWNWFSSSSSTSKSGSEIVRGSASEFSGESFSDKKAMKLLEHAKAKMMISNSCWQKAYMDLFAGCSEILPNEDLRAKFAWQLSGCFQKQTGRPPLPYCDFEPPMYNCLKALDADTHKVYLEFYLDTNTLCYQLQSHAFKHEVERLVTDLKDSANYVEDKLDEMLEKSEIVLHGSIKVHDSIDSLNVQTQEMEENIVSMVNRTSELVRKSEGIYEETRKITESQEELKRVQQEMQQGMEAVTSSHKNLTKEITNIRQETEETQKKMIQIGESMSQQMHNLHSKTEDITHLASISLNNQQNLIHSQSKALHNLNSLSLSQSKAFLQTRMTFQQLAKIGQKQHKDVLERQEQLEGLHDRLMKNSISILATQESFQTKQTTMLNSLDKIFNLQNAIFIESRLIKAFIIYSVAIFVIYMLTSTKQTFGSRPWLYIGLCLVFLLETSIVRFSNSEDLETQRWIITMIRSFFTIAASAQLLYAIFTYKDYSVLNYHLLQDLVDKVNMMEKQQLKKLVWEIDEEEDELDWIKFVDSDLPEEVNLVEDPDFEYPLEEAGENSIIVSARKYNFRARRN